MYNASLTKDRIEGSLILMGRRAKSIRIAMSIRVNKPGAKLRMSRYETMVPLKEVETREIATQTKTNSETGKMLGNEDSTTPPSKPLMTVS